MNWQLCEAQMSAQAGEAVTICGCCRELGHNFDNCPVALRDRVQFLEAQVALLEDRLPNRCERWITGGLWFLAGVVSLYLGMVLRG
jgi:hypothetical protein